MRAKTLAALSTLAAAALLGGSPASAAVLTVAPGGASFSGVSTAGTTTGQLAGARPPARAPEPETYALILAGLLFVGLRARAQRP